MSLLLVKYVNMNQQTHADMITNIWQVAAGDGERAYWDVFLQFGVMLIGPGTALGDYRKNKAKYEKQHVRALPRFAEEANKNDLVVIKGE
jgi:hypothetical protein